MREQAELLASLDRRIKALEQLESFGGVLKIYESSEPATPPTGYCVLWYNSSNELWVKTDGGVSTQLN